MVLDLEGLGGTRRDPNEINPFATCAWCLERMTNVYLLLFFFLFCDTCCAKHLICITLNLPIFITWRFTAILHIQNLRVRPWPWTMVPTLLLVSWRTWVLQGTQFENNPLVTLFYSYFPENTCSVMCVGFLLLSLAFILLYSFIHLHTQLPILLNRHLLNAYLESRTLEVTLFLRRSKFPLVKWGF